MNILSVDLLNDFFCIADACPNTCCAGWNISIDKETYQKMVENEDKLGVSVKDLIYRKEDTYKVKLQKDGRCPLLNENNLCKVVLAFGDSYLSKVCTTYPRVYRKYGSVIEGHLVSSCPDVIAKLMSKEDIYFDFSENDIPADPYEYGQLYLYENAIRTSIIDLLYNFRELSLNTRLFVSFKIMDEAISHCTDNAPDYNMVKEYIDSYYAEGVMTALNDSLQYIVKESSRYHFIQNIINIFQHTIPLKFSGRYIKLIERTINYFGQNDFEQYARDISLFRDAIKSYHNFYTNYWVYRLFSEMIEIPDYVQVKEKFIFVGIEFCLIQAIALASFVQDQTLEQDEYIYIISSVSRVEHASRQKLVDQLSVNDMISAAGLLLLII